MGALAGRASSKASPRKIVTRAVAMRFSELSALPSAAWYLKLAPIRSEPRRTISANEVTTSTFESSTSKMRARPNSTPESSSRDAKTRFCLHMAIAASRAAMTYPAAGKTI